MSITIYTCFLSVLSLELLWLFCKKGRSNESDIKVNDISVSRNHCAFVLGHNEIFLEDIGSKFGTLVNMKGKLRIIPDKALFVQKGKHLIKLNIDLSKCCCFWSSKNKLCYSAQNNFLAEQELQGLSRFVTF